MSVQFTLKPAEHVHKVGPAPTPKLKCPNCFDRNPWFGGVFAAQARGRCRNCGYEGPRAGWHENNFKHNIVAQLRCARVEGINSPEDAEWYQLIIAELKVRGVDPNAIR
jgi:hypothetical protein